MYSAKLEKTAAAVLLTTLLGLATPSRAATFHVTSTADGGGGTLRAAINAANAAAGPDIIVFDVSGTITLSSALPSLTDNATEIHGETAPGVGSPPRITIQGIFAFGPGILINGAANCVVRGIRVTNFLIGIDVANGATFNQIGDTGAGELNIAVACTTGVRIRDAGSDHNTVVNNRCFQNIITGISLRAAQLCTIGGLAAGESNACFQNRYGIFLDGAAGATSNNEILGNRVGTDNTGVTSGLGNGLDGITLFGSGCTDNLVRGNIIVSNGANGIARTWGGGRNKITANMIGMDITGAAALANVQHGIYMIGPCTADTVGPANVISANGACGIAVLDDEGVGHHIYGNKIGTDVSGTVVFPNVSDGILFAGNAILMGGASGEGNLIRANGGWGIHGKAYQETSSLDVMQFNEILENAAGGILLQDGCVNNLVGGYPGVTDRPNHIHDNTGPGVEVGPVAPVAAACPVQNKIVNNVIERNTIPIDLTEYHTVGYDCWGNDYIPVPMIQSASGGTVTGVTNLPAAVVSHVEVFFDIFGTCGLAGWGANVAGDPHWTVTGTWPAGATLYATNTAIYAGEPTPETSEYSTGFIPTTAVVSASGAPARFELRLDGPNPAVGVSRVLFAAPRATSLQLEVFDIAGRRVTTLHDGMIEAGMHPFAWDGRDRRGAPAGSGLYLVRARFAGGSETLRTLRVR